MSYIAKVTLDIYFSLVMAAITNVSMTANLFPLKGFLDLKMLCNNLANCIYQNTYFVRLVKRLREPKVTVMIYDTGKLVCVGATSIENGRRALRVVGRQIQKLGYNVTIHNIQVANIAGSHQLNTLFDIKKLYNSLSLLKSTNVFLETEIFPHMIIDLNTYGKITLTRKGKMILTGCKTEENLNFLLSNFLNIFNSFVKTL